jgi:molecular chaperone HtpG
MFKEADLDAVVLDCSIDNHFISFLEAKENGVIFTRIDSDISETLKNSESEDSKELNTKLEELFKEATSNKVNNIKVENLKNSGTPAMILVSEQSRRMAEMSKMFGGMEMPNMFMEEKTLVINNNNSIIKKLASVDFESKKDDINLICQYILDLALIANKELSSEEMNDFINRSNELLNKVIEL